VSPLDAVVVGSGPNGLAAAVTLAGAGLSVSVIEGADTAGGGCRTGPATLPGYRHDVCSAVHPLLLASPFFRLPAFDALRASLRQPEVPMAHPLDGGTAVAAYRSVEQTSAALGADGPAYLRLMGPLVREAQALADQVLAPLRTFPGHPVTMARFGIPGLLPVEQLVRGFRSEEAKALLGGLAAHSMQPLSAPLTAAFALLLATTAHAVGWPVVAGGSGAITDAMVGELTRRGGTIETGRWVRSLSELPRSTAVVLDTSPRGLLALAGPISNGRSTRALHRFR
jgi:phytoene dehydrogenase-like protein